MINDLQLRIHSRWVLPQVPNNSRVSFHSNPRIEFNSTSYHLQQSGLSGPVWTSYPYPFTRSELICERIDDWPSFPQLGAVLKITTSVEVKNCLKFKKIILERDFIE
jgi:hypothetical protein